MQQIIDEIRKEIGDAPIFCNIMCALSDYDNIVKNAIEVGFNGIICGAGFQEKLPFLLRKYAGENHDIAIIPIINHRALPLLLRSWKKNNNKIDIYPDALILEGPLSGGHQGYTPEQITDPNFQLEKTVPTVLKQIEKTGQNIPLIVAGGIMYQDDILRFLIMGCVGVQMGSRFLMTEESDASPQHKTNILKIKSPDDIEIAKSPAGYPSRRIRTKMVLELEKGKSFYVSCKSNCLTKCNHGEVAEELGYCIADQLGKGYRGEEDGLYFAGARAWEIDKIITVEELVIELTDGLYD